MSVDSAPKVLREVVLTQLAAESRAYKMWLPPLADPLPVNELIDLDRERRPLRFGLGVMDEPRRHRQDIWGIDVSSAAGNIAVGEPAQRAIQFVRRSRVTGDHRSTTGPGVAFRE